MNRNFLAFAMAAIVALSACKKEDKKDNGKPNNGTTSISIELEHVWGASAAPFELGKEYIQPMSGEKLTLTMLKYYLSNFQMKRSDGTVWAEPESYRIVDLGTHGSLPNIIIPNVPVGDYTEISFTIGVDSLRNVSGAQDGALSPSNGMFWSWNTGYIFTKVEGLSPASPSGAFTYHLGGFKSPNNAIQVKSFIMPGGVISLQPNAAPVFHFLVNAARFWHGGIKTADISIVHAPGLNAVTFSINFANGVVLDHIHM